MKKIDFEHGRTLNNIMATAIPMLVAQILNLLYNIVDRIYIARIPKVGTVALGAVGLCFPIVILVTAFTNMYGGGGAPLFSIARGKRDEARARLIQNTAFLLLVITALVLTVGGELLGKCILKIFGTSDASMVYALPYLRIYILGTIFSMIATGMNPFITAQGFSLAAMTTVVVGAMANIILDPIFIFVLGLGVQGAALATIISQGLSAVYVLIFLFGKRCDYKLKLMSSDEIKGCGKVAQMIILLGSASFMTQFTNAVVQIICNSVLSNTGGDIYISVMTIVNSARQMMETPIIAITEGSSPIISYNYGAGKYDRIKKSIIIMFSLTMGYTVCVWTLIRLAPTAVIGIFTGDKTILVNAVPAFNLYFSTFIFMVFQYCGQIVFKSLGKKGKAIFFSLFRKAVIVAPLTYILPYWFKMGVNGVFAAEPISNVIGGMACFITMLITVSAMFKTKKFIQKPVHQIDVSLK